MEMEEQPGYNGIKVLSCRDISIDKVLLKKRIVDPTLRNPKTPRI